VTDRPARAAGSIELSHGFRFAPGRMGRLGFRRPMKPAPVLLLATALLSNLNCANALTSPDGHLAVEVHLTEAHAAVYQVKRDGRLVLGESKLGLIREDADFTRGLQASGASPIEAIADDYEMLTAKRRHNAYRANRQAFHFMATDGARLDVIFQVSNDGVAFRYRFPETSPEIHPIKEETTSFHLLPDTQGWLQPMQVAKSGWKSTNPAYEEYYQIDIPAGTPSPLGAGWVFPALFKSGDTWLLLSEAGLDRKYCASRLRHESPDGEYSIGFPDPRETIHGAPVNPSSTLPWSTPWRLIAIGSLKTLAESTLGTDLAEPAAAPAGPEIKPGKASWSWPLLGDSQTTYDVQKQFIDFAADMGWRYCLIDSMWDQQIGYDQIKELADYARGKNVGLLLWYNTNGDWNEAPQTPKHKLLTHADRLAEFTRLKAMGIRGLKVDFFGGDGQPVINLYHDLLEDSAPFGLVMNFHGATLPRGWGRTYPHLMTMEAVKGFEFITFEQANADQEPVFATVLPFARNIFDPMDFTPVCLDKTGKTKLRTTAAFELALSVLFTSGVQHYPDLPTAMTKVPDYVKDFLRHVPSVWEDTKFLDGYPGKYVALARFGEGRWFVTGINGEGAPKMLTLDLSVLSAIKGTGNLISDGDDRRFQRKPVTLGADRKLSVTLEPHGGFVLVLD
jgi:alpha-glucosidase